MLDMLLLPWQLLLPPHPHPLCPMLVLYPAGHVQTWCSLTLVWFRLVSREAW